jgi:hypothetical protein
MNEFQEIEGWIKEKAHAKGQVTKQFVTAGKATFTLELPESFREKTEAKPHYTFRVNRSPASLRYPEAYFVKMLAGPDNENSYVYVGMLRPDTGKVDLTAKSKLGEQSLPYRLLGRVLARLWSNETHVLEQHGFKLHHEGQCGRCGRLLTTPESVERGIGPECIKMMG